MALAKVVAVIYLRDLIKANGEAMADKFLKILSSEERKMFQTMMPITKFPIEQITRFYELAMPLLFPDKSLSEGLRQFGFQNAQSDMKGIYRFILKFLSLETVIKQAATIWKIYHDKGKASVQLVTSKNVIFIVEDYPEIPKNFREVLNGYIAGLITLAGEKGINVVRNDADPNAWKWVINVG